MQPTPNSEVGQAIRDWFRTLEECVGRVDYERARTIFAPDAIGFGTKATIAEGIEALQENQWSGIWPNIDQFRFVLDQLRWGADGDLAWGIVPWTSIGFGENGQPFDRPGRATVIFVRREGRWLALHTHFSLAPGTPGVTRRPRA